ncbi:hypothetical protein HB780_14585 [Rhizobium lusitanum]|uniref:hypothetical protein n=1 Tax=Rhizobium lusitanum TaxID=293958 RepID=UPI00160A2646|nr:hypothetical protein [Rhizobium lusitanum]QND46963.1 hypothetical protein HB780_14585 [Rhizobium lusitanum]
MSQIDQCVETTFNAFVSGSKSTCVGVSKYYDSGGNTNSSSHNNYYDITDEEWGGYRYKKGTEKVFHEGGACIHEMSASIINDTKFLCYYYTKGCGELKGGGHVKGYCSVDVEYLPRAGDVVAIKRYCLSKFSGGTVLPTPLSYPVGCELP